MTKSTITRERTQQIFLGNGPEPSASEERELARMTLVAMDSESGCLPLDYLQGHKEGLEWAAQLAEANHPETGDWFYDDPIELAKAIRKGPDMPPAQPVADSEPVAYIDKQWTLVYYVPPMSMGLKIGDKLYRHAQPAPVEVSVIDDVKTIIRILNDNDWNDTEGFRGIKTDIGKSLESWIDRIIDQIKPSGLRPDEIKKYIRETLIEKGLYDGLRLALSNAGIAAPESDEMLAVKQERYVQELVTWVRDRKPIQPAPVVPDELLKEYLRLVDCMLSDYRDSNYGDAQRWIRHIADASDAFEEKHGLSSWEMARKNFRAAMLAAAPHLPGSEPATVPVIPARLVDSVTEVLRMLDEYPERLVPVNRQSALIRELRSAVLEAASIERGKQ